MGEAKKRKHRDCPARGGIITPEDCGRGRNSAIACPVDCPHNPFALANYREQFGALEEKVIAYLGRKLLGELTPSQLRELSSLVESGNSVAIHAQQAFQIHGAGRLENWIAAGFHREWKNDEQTLLHHLTTLRPVLLEFHEVLDDVSCTAVDLLDPGEPVVVIDANAAGRVGRFERGLGWIYDLPAGRRMSGPLVAVPRVGDLEPADVFRRVLDHLDAPPGAPRAWVLEHMPLIAEAFAAIETARREAQIRASDLRRFTLSHPILAGKAREVIAVLEAHPRVFADDPDETRPLFAASLLAEGADRDRDGEADVIGALNIYQDELKVEAFAAPRADSVRTLLASLGLPIGVEEAIIEDAAASYAGRSYDHDLVPPRFLEDIAPVDVPSKVCLRDSEDFPGSEIAWLYRGYADKPNEALQGKTPREAAGDVSLRPRLVRLMKDLTCSCDQQRRTKGVDFDFNVVLRDLGLHDLILPPPPLGLVADDEEDYDDDIPLDPPPPQEMLDGEELDNRLNAVVGDEALWNRLEIRLADVLDAFNDLTDKLNAHELETLQGTVLAALGALHPVPPPGYDPDPERMLACYENWITSGDDKEELPDYVERIFEETRQPALCEAAGDMLFVLEEQSGKKLRAKKLDVIMTALAAAIWEAAHWPPA